MRATAASSGGKCLHSSAVNCIVPDIVISPYTRHKVSSTDFSHYSLLKMTEKLLGVHLLGHAAERQHPQPVPAIRPVPAALTRRGRSAAAPS